MRSLYVVSQEIVAMKFSCLFCVSFILLQQSIAVKLNFPRVLLPIFDKLPINFTLEVIEGGCFKW